MKIELCLKRKKGLKEICQEIPGRSFQIVGVLSTVS